MQVGNDCQIPHNPLYEEKATLDTPSTSSELFSSPFATLSVRDKLLHFKTNTAYRINDNVPQIWTQNQNYIQDNGQELLVLLL